MNEQEDNWYTSPEGWRAKDQTGGVYPEWEPNQWKYVPDPYYPTYPTYPTPTTVISGYTFDPTVVEKLDKIIELLEKLIDDSTDEVEQGRG